MELEIEPSELSLLNPPSLQKYNLLLYLSTEFKKGSLKMLLGCFHLGFLFAFVLFLISLKASELSEGKHLHFDSILQKAF